MPNPDRRDWGGGMKFIVSMGIRKLPGGPQDRKIRLKRRAATGLWYNTK
jgi:hypothetical protein